MIKRMTYLVEFVVHANDDDDFESKRDAINDALDQLLTFMDAHTPYQDEINKSGPTVR